MMDVSLNPHAIIDLEVGWRQIKSRAIDILEGYIEFGFLSAEPAVGSAASTSDGGAKLDSALFTRADYSHLYKTVYDMCVQRTPHNHSEQLYKRYGDTIQIFCQEKVMPMVENKEKEAFLVEFYDRWIKHKIYVKWLARFFSYLDRYYVKISDSFTVEREGFHIFYITVFQGVRQRLTEAILDQIDKERNGYIIDRELLKDVVAVYHHFEQVVSDVYRVDLELSFLESTKEHYERIHAGWIQSDTFPEYILKAQHVLYEENMRCEKYLHSSTAPKCEIVVVKVLLEDKLKLLLEKETAVQHLLENDRREDLKRTFSLLSLVNNGVQELAAIFKSFVTVKGNDIISERERTIAAAAAAQSSPSQEYNNPEFIQKLVDLHENFKIIVTDCFAHDFTINKALKEAFEVFLNRDLGAQSLSQLMVSYCDRILKKSTGRLREENVESLLNSCVELFGFLSDKDLFLDIYKTMLAKRLLYETSASEDAEKYMISQLKLRCGQQFTSKLEGMVTDLGVATELQREFSNYIRQTPDKRLLLCGIDFTAQILTTKNWPTYATQEVSLPPEMERCLTTFFDFYKAKQEMNKSRRISWIHSFGSVTIQASFARKYDLLCNTYQCCLLLLFNNARIIPFTVLKESLRLDDLLLKKLLGSFFMRRHQILSKVKNEKTSDKGIDPSDEFQINQSFSANVRKIKIPTPLQEEVHHRERVEEDRGHTIQAAIVRIMKMRKKLKHHQLITEVIAQLQFFQPAPKSIKVNIEQLIQREFLERDAAVADLYCYVA